MNFVSRILAGETIPDQEIREHNARMCLAQAKAMSENQHDPNGCKVKNCTHGDERLIESLINHAARLVSGEIQYPVR